jgi:hypothetical protein
LEILIDPKISRIKFEKEIESLMLIKHILRKKGWIIECVEFPIVRVTFLTAKVQPPIAQVTVELNYANYNILPPSVKFLNPVTFDPIIITGLQIVDGNSNNIVLQPHPKTKLAFFCMAGVQEYHSHPQHDGDSWDIYRYSEKDSLFYILDKIWLYCISIINSFLIQLQINMSQISLKYEAK